MKKLITGILALTMSVACFAGVTACSDKNKDPISSSSEDNTAKLEALESAGEFLKEKYKDEVKAVGSDYKLPNTTTYDGTTFNIAWSVEVKTEGKADSVKVEVGDEETVINVDELTKEEITYVLTATISDDDDNSVTVDFNCKVFVNGSIVAPVENTAYNMYIEQKGAYKNLLLTGEMDETWFGMTTNNAEAAEVYVENATNGYKFYIKGENDAKSYITLEEYQKTNGYYGAHVSFSETGSVFYYDAVGCWACVLANDTYFLGTYGTFETASASASNFMKAENMGVSQFPLLIAIPGTFTGGEIEPEFELPTADSELTIAQALELAGKYASDTYTPHKYYVTATVKAITNDTHGNMTITDGTNDLTVYGTWDSTGTNKYGAMTGTKPVAGDTVKLYGVLGTYNGACQMKNGWIMSVTAGSGSEDGGNTGGETTTVTTIADALSAAEGATATFSGTVSEIYYAWSDQYNNMSFYVSDGPNRILVFRAGTKVEIGDTVSVSGTVTVYNSVNQIAEGATVTVTTAGGNGGSTGGETTDGYTEMTIPQALEAADNTKIIVTGTVVKIKEAYNSQYNNISVYIADDNGVQLHLYRVTGNVEVGQIIKVTGTMATYSGNRQVAQGGTFETVGTHTCTKYADATCKAPSSCIVCGTAKDNVLAEHTYANGICSVCGASENPENDVTLAVFEFGANGSAAHKDGSEIGASKDYTSGDYTLSLTACSKVYDDAYDAKGNSCIKLGTGSATAALSFTVGNDVTKVIIKVAGYKANEAKMSVNGTEYSITTASADGAYTEIVVDTSSTKTVSVATLSGGYRAMIDSITFVGSNA